MHATLAMQVSACRRDNAAEAQSGWITGSGLNFQDQLERDFLLKACPRRVIDPATLLARSIPAWRMAMTSPSK